MQMDFTVQQNDILAVIKTVGDRITSLNTESLKDILSELKRDGVKNINLHIASVSFVDSSGLSAILIARKMCKDANGSFVLSGLHPNVVKLLKVSQLDSIIDTMPTEQEADEFIKMEELTRQITAG